MANMLDELRRASKRRPFRAFVIHLTDGGEVAVKHPEMVLFPKWGEVIACTNEDAHFLDPRQISRVTYSRARRPSPR